MRTVRNIIDSKPAPFNIIAPEVLVIDALKSLTEVNLSYLIVKDGNTYLGVFSERDYTRNVILKGRSSKETTVKEVMTTDLPEVNPADTVESCMNLMDRKKTRYLVAFDDGNFLGIITIHDMLRQVIASKEQVFDSALTKRLLDNDESSRIY